MQQAVLAAAIGIQLVLAAVSHTGQPRALVRSFQIYSPTEATLRGNLFYAPVIESWRRRNGRPFLPSRAYGNDMPALVEAANPSTALRPHADRHEAGHRHRRCAGLRPRRQRILTVLYLTALSGQYAVQY